jgi:hypothetical protein
MKKIFACISVLLWAVMCAAQTEAAYESEDKNESPGLLDPSRLTVHHSAAFGMSSSSGSSMKSQSLYSTYMQYKFSAPVTLDLNFSLPIHSTYAKAFNLTSENLQSKQYFESVPFDVSLSWRPLDNLLMRFTVAKSPMYDPFYGPRPYSLWGPEPLMFNPLYPEQSEAKK